ncbi:hypothetical protein ABZ023_30960 [Streptomyces sp. NPDC006367]|uniref:hypothetical protein n=1 Tax=unclassified Streptomyces TaxID=2593676 RepID=UPI0033AB981B
MRTLTLAGHSGPLTLPERPTTDDYAPLPHGLSLADTVAVRAHQVRPGDLLVAEFTDGTGVRPTEHIPGPYPADPHSLPACPCEGCETCDETTAWTLGDDSRTADAGWRFVCLAPSQDGEPCTIVLRNRPMAVIPADVVARAQTARPHVSTADLAPLSVLDDAETQLRTAAGAALTLIARTLRAQYPTGAYLVLTRPTDYEGNDDDVMLNSIRDAQGKTVCRLNPYRGSTQLPAVPDDIGALWGATDPRNPAAVLYLLQRVDSISRYEFFHFLPEQAMRDGEVAAERKPLGIPLDPEAICPQHGTACEPDDHIEPPTVNGEAI